MPAHTIRIVPPVVPPARKALPALVFRVLFDEHWPETTAIVDPGYPPTVEYIPNVVVESISERAGAFATTADLRYRFDTPIAAAMGWPTRAEQVFAFDATGPYVLKPDDRLIVAVPNKDGTYKMLLDGFMSVPQLNLGERTEAVTMRVVARTARAADTPLGGAWYRDTDRPDGPADPDNDPPTDRQTTWPAFFNEDGKGNMCPSNTKFIQEGWWINQHCPLFFHRDSWPTEAVKWTLPDAVAYCLVIGNSQQRHVIHEWTLLTIYDKLCTILPKDENVPIDMEDPATFTRQPLPCPSIDVTGMLWHEAVQRLVAPHGFELIFELTRDIITGPGEYKGLYYEARIIDRKKPDNRVGAYMQKKGSQFSAGKDNVQQVTVTRDSSQIVNVFRADTQQIEVEASFILFPRFAIDPADAASPRSDDFKKQSDNFRVDDNSRRYRDFGVNESGFGYWDFNADPEAWVTEPIPDLGWVLDIEDYLVEDFTRGSVRMPRPALAHLFRKLDAGEFMRPILEVSADYPYMTEGPGLWNPKGEDTQHWMPITRGGWEVADRWLGIRVTVEDPNVWEIAAKGEAGYADAPSCLTSGKLRLVKAFAQPDDANPRVVFRFTCVVRLDRGILGMISGPDPASPTKFRIERREDVRDRWGRQYVSQYSALGTDREGPTFYKNDRDLIAAHLEARRIGNESARLAGTVGIARHTQAYKPGQQLDKIHGRDISLSSVRGYDKRYPTIVGRDWKFGDANATVLQLEDLRADGEGGRRER